MFGCPCFPQWGHTLELEGCVGTFCQLVSLTFDLLLVKPETWRLKLQSLWTHRSDGWQRACLILHCSPALAPDSSPSQSVLDGREVLALEASWFPSGTFERGQQTRSKRSVTDPRAGSLTSSEPRVHIR
ncbi:hypothetical protein GBF38_002766 [Nibea albiflora]|uniref:Uncharacterized protein n=1 Tax=Nibea albiflora TaxID=240163 RepID=A0ACB7EE29_NIBAL|nr:hypothetical protein GBF38_002766 [Nibea albiflora]